MYLVVIAWLYVALMMAVAEATSKNGSLLGAIVTFFVYGLGPAALVAYLMGWPSRNRQRKAREAAEWEQYKEAREAMRTTPASTLQAPSSGEPDTGGEAPTDPVPPVRKQL